MWPGASTSQAQTNVRVVKHRLTRVAGCPVLAVGATVQPASGVTCDITAFKRRPASSLAPQEVRLLLEQPLLGQFEYPELDEFASLLGRERELLRELALDAAVHQAEELANGTVGTERALDLLNRVGEERPADERACRLSMRLLMARHDRAGALVAFERCRDALSTQLGVGPSPATASLHRSVLLTRDEDQERLPLGETSIAAVDSPPFVEREALLPRIWLALRQGRIVWVTGEAGLGKTRLLQEALRARSNAVRVSCRPSDPAQPYSSLARLVEALARAEVTGRAHEPEVAVRTLGNLRSRRGSRGRLDSAQVLSAFEALLRQAGERGVSTVAFDDLHFIDRASAEVLHGWCDRLKRARTSTDVTSLPGLAFASRVNEHGAGVEQLRSLLDGSDALERIDLRPLSLDALRGMLEGMELPWLAGPDAPARLLARSGGNPYFAIEIIRESRWAQQPELLRASPVSVLEMLGARIERLDRAAQDLALLVAVSGEEYASPLADELLGLQPLEHARAWRALERAGIFDERGLAHDLARAAVLHHLPATGLEVLNARIADFLLRRGAEPGVIARRLVAAGRRPEAYPHALEAAHHLVDVLGLDQEAVELLDLVLGEGLPRGPRAFELCELRCQLTHWASGAIPAAVGHMQELAQSADERERAALARARCLTWALADSTSPQEAVEELLSAVRPGSPHRMVLLASLVLTVRVLRQPAWARKLGAELAGVVREDPARVDALPMSDLRRVSEGLLGGEQAALEAREMQRQAARLRAAHRLVDLYQLQRIVQASMWFAGDLEGWSQASQELERLRPQVGPRHRPDEQQTLGDALMWVAAGDLETARALLVRQEASTLDAYGQWTLRLGWLLLWQTLGQEERFDSVLAQPLDAGPPALTRAWQAWEMAIVAAEKRHRGIDARSWVEAGRQTMAGQGSPVAMTLDLLHAGSLEPEPALSLVRRVFEEATGAGRLGAAASACVELASMEYRLGNVEAARLHALEAARLLKRYGNYVIWRGNTHMTLLSVLEACDPEAAIGFRARCQAWTAGVLARLPQEFVVGFRKRWVL
jgi:DNA-binding SARP family transcriptional activator